MHANVQDISNSLVGPTTFYGLRVCHEAATNMLNYQGPQVDLVVCHHSFQQAHFVQADFGLGDCSKSSKQVYP